jgi:hypothetical protein
MLLLILVERRRLRASKKEAPGAFGSNRSRADSDVCCTRPPQKHRSWAKCRGLLPIDADRALRKIKPMNRRIAEQRAAV